MNKLLVICGPTATGKTALAAGLAKKFNGELISADSRQVYKNMDLVTGKDRPDVPVWLYDVVSPDEEFSVSHWVELANKAIADIGKRNKLPIVVGGTGLYIKALLEPFDTIDIPPDETLREKLQKLQLAALQKMIPRGTMNESDWNNPRRLIRKIEIARSKIEFHKQIHPYDYLILGLSAPMPFLYSRIDGRLKERIRRGLKEEADLLLARYNPHLPSMTAIGLNEHAYARRQMTWFKNMPSVHWFDISKGGYEGDVTAKVSQWYTNGAL